MKKSIFAIAFAALLAGFTYYSASVNAADSKAEVYEITAAEKPKDNNAVNFSVNKNGKKVSFSEMTKGKVVFLNFWGTWCPPCRKEIPDIVKLSKDYSGKGVMVIGVALERGGTADDNIKKVVEFAGKQGIGYMNAVDQGRLLAEAYGGIQAVPTTYIIGKDGKIAEKIVGMRSYDEFAKSLNKAL